jgi:hypothetical protein
MALKLEWRRAFAATVTATGLLLAQAAGSYNFGTPELSGTHTPEDNPGTAVARPQSSGSGALVAPSAGAASTSGMPSAPSGPAYSFGAAPPPLVSPNR